MQTASPLHKGDVSILEHTASSLDVRFLTNHLAEDTWFPCQNSLCLTDSGKEHETTQEGTTHFLRFSGLT